MASQTKHDHTFKFLIIGDSGCGKTCLLKYFTERKFHKGVKHTIGIEFGSKLLTVGGKQIRLQIWDTAGQDRFRSVTRNYYRGAVGCLLVYDITNRESYTHLMTWLNAARTHASPNIQVILVGNKNDLRANREVSVLEASRFAQENELQFIETSAVSGDCVDEVFLKLTTTVLDKQSGVTNEEDPNQVDPTQNANVYAGCRC